MFSDSNRRKQKKQLPRCFVRRLVRCDWGALHRRIDQLENHGCDNSSSEVGQQINPDVSPAGNAENADAQSDCGIKSATRNITDGERADHHCNGEGVLGRWACAQGSVKPEKPSTGLRCLGNPPGDEPNRSVIERR